ncbi:MAG: peptide deformylase [Halobacteriovoraceae bacterium]|nr:peptide deformylase [Halobacteriovoraceae bacterium]
MKLIVDDPNFPHGAKELDIVVYPNPILKKVAEPVEVFDEELKELCQNMLYTMYKAPGIGLAAPQIGIGKRIFVMDVDYDREFLDEDGNEVKISNLNPRIFINPQLKNHEGKTTYQEGCLSVPNIFDDVERYKTVDVEYQDVNGNKHTISTDDLLSICIQHENDHLDGIVFIEKLSHLKFNFYRQKLVKEKTRRGALK